MNHFLVRVVFVWYSFLQFGHSTRFLPMVVWDHLNPLLSCKCNWLTIPRIDIYDRVDFVCPSLKIAVKMLDGYSRPTGEMNENIFRRKWMGSKDDLISHIKNGTLDYFCDPAKSDLLYSCKNGEDGKAVGVNFKRNSGDESKSYENGVYVFFNNGDDGKVETLGSTLKKCAMVFAVNYKDKTAKVEHDMSYGKYLNPDDKYCMQVNTTSEYLCKGVPQPKSISPTPVLSTSTSLLPSANSSVVSLTQARPVEVPLMTKCTNRRNRTMSLACNISNRTVTENDGNVTNGKEKTFICTSGNKTKNITEQLEISCRQVENRVYQCNTTENKKNMSGTDDTENTLMRNKWDWICSVGGLTSASPPTTHSVTRSVLTKSFPPVTQSVSRSDRSTDPCSINHVLVVIVIILATLSASLMLVILWMVLRGSQGQKNLKKIIKMLTRSGPNKTKDSQPNI